jgi:Calpain family cysteine protease/Bacterial pre-peptidase C-terminal domain
MTEFFDLTTSANIFTVPFVGQNSDSSGLQGLTRGTMSGSSDNISSYFSYAETDLINNGPAGNDIILNSRANDFSGDYTIGGSKGDDATDKLIGSSSAAIHQQVDRPDSLLTRAAGLDDGSYDTLPKAREIGNFSGESLTASTRGTVSYSSYLDLYRFTVEVNSRFDIRLNGLTADVSLALFQDKNGDGKLGEDEVIATSTEPGNQPEAIENIGLSAGIYFVRVQQYEGTTNYNLTVAGTPGQSQKLAGDSPDTALDIGNGPDVQVHDFVAPDNSGFYRFSTIGNQSVNIDVALNNADINLKLFRDRNDNGTAESDEVVAEDINSISVRTLPPGTYFIEASTLDAATSYQLNVDAFSGSGRTEVIDPLFVGSTLQRRLNQNDDTSPFDNLNYADTYGLIDFEPGQTIALEVTSTEFHPVLAIINPYTQEVLYYVDAEGGTASISFTTESGNDYRVVVTSTDEPGIGLYQISTQVTNLPPTGTPNDLPIADTVATDDPPPVFVQEVVIKGVKTKNRYDLIYKNLQGPLTRSGNNNIDFHIEDINQGVFGDCAFLAAVGSTFSLVNASDAGSKPSTILNNTIQPFTDESGNTRYKVVFFNNRGVAEFVTVDNSVVTNNLENGKPSSGVGNLFGATPRGATPGEPETNPENPSNTPIWMSILEHAYAKYRGIQIDRNGYDVMGNGDSPQFPMRRLTGKTVEYFNFRQDTKEALSTVTALGVRNPSTVDTASGLFDRIKIALSEGRFVTTGTGDDSDPRSNEVLVGGHAYTLTNAYVDSEGNERIVVRNPWGHDNGKLDKFFDEDPNKNPLDGFVEMYYTTFLRTFQDVALSTTESISADASRTS